MSETKLMLDYLYDHEARQPDRVYLTQPLGGGQTVDYTWRQVMDEARRMANYLRQQGLQPGDRVALLSKNCAHFFIAEMAIWIGGFTTVAIFPTESANTIRYVLDHSEARLLFVGKLDTWADQRKGLPDGLPLVRLPLGPSDVSPAWNDLIASTPPVEGRPARQPDDLAMLIYTSGSTGQPKGVMHSFERMTRATEGIAKGLPLLEERVLSYLPLAHIFERAYIACGSMLTGTVHVYFAESLDTFVADLKRAQPTLFLSVPRLWLKFQQGVFAKMPPKRLDFLLKIPIVKGIIARRVLEGLGLSHVRLAGSGSAPIPAELISWYRRLGLNLMEGYAMTEDFAYSHLSTAAANAPGYVGVPYEGVHVRISDEGEVLIKSPGTMVGYYKRPDLTAEAFTADGFFRTGDKGERRSDGLLKLTGRIKELFKTAKGKYVAPAPIENTLNEHELIELSCVSGSGMPAAYAQVVLAEHIRPKVQDPAERARIEAELGAWLDKVNAGLSTYEQLQMLVILPEPWTIENGRLTPTMKVKRAKVEEAAAPHVEKWYATRGKVIWA